MTVTEGNTGTVNATFTVTLSAASTATVTVHYATADGTATAGSDYTAASGTVTIPAGQTSATITVAVNGDRLAEPTETFAVNLSAATNATIADGQGDRHHPRQRAADQHQRRVARQEGNGTGTTLFTFTVTLSAAYDQPVTMSFRTAERHRDDRRQRLRRQDRHADLRPRRDDQDDHDRGQGRQQEGGRTRRSTSTCSATAAIRVFTKNRGIGTILNDD